MHSWIKSNNSIMCCFPCTTNSLFLKLFLRVCLQCNFLLFLKFKTESLASKTENVKLFRPHSGAGMGQWVKHIFLGSLYILMWHNCTLSYLMEIKLVNTTSCSAVKIAIMVASLLSCPPTELEGAFLPLQTTCCSFQMSRVG